MNSHFFSLVDQTVKDKHRIQAITNRRNTLVILKHKIS